MRQAHTKPFLPAWFELALHLAIAVIVPAVLLAAGNETWEKLGSPGISSVSVEGTVSGETVTKTLKFDW